MNTEDLDEDLLQLELPDGCVLDVGWYPSCDPSGRYVLQIVKDRNWQEPVEKIETTSLREIWHELENILRYRQK